MSRMLLIFSVLISALSCGNPAPKAEGTGDLGTLGSVVFNAFKHNDYELIKKRLTDEHIHIAIIKSHGLSEKKEKLALSNIEKSMLSLNEEVAQAYKEIRDDATELYGIDWGAVELRDVNYTERTIGTIQKGDVTIILERERKDLLIRFEAVGFEDKWYIGKTWRLITAN